MKINKIAVADSTYLSPLASLAVPPKQLHILGTLPQARRPSIAIVGTRKPTAYGREVTELFARQLAMRGIIVISGLAIGVDSIAHRTALEAKGTTLAILANALPAIYPASNRQLADAIIASGGAVISEHGPDDHYVVGKWSFLERNRLVSGLADAILITEASASSGTLNTASHALEQGKDVFVVPGNITSPSSLGCNTLIKQGAIPVTSPEDILEIVSPSQHTLSQSSLPLGDTALENAIIRLISDGMRDGDSLQQSLDIPIAELNAALTMMELRGLVRSLGASRWTLR